MDNFNTGFLLFRSNLTKCIETEVDGSDADAGVDGETYVWNKKTVSYEGIAFTIILMLLSVYGVWLNIQLAVEYYQQGEHRYFLWTVICMVVPMCVAALIHAQMCHQDNRFKGGCRDMSQTLLDIFSSLFLRSWKSLYYSIKCKSSERQANREEQLEYYKLMTKEECDVALIGLFHCFMGAAPQRILLMSIMLMQNNQVTDTQVCSVLFFLVTVPFAMAAYNRSIRAAQPIKNKLSYWYMAPHLCWHFCITVSRTLCITFIAVIFPIMTIVACILHAIIAGFVTYVVERPQFFSIVTIHNFLFSIALGFIYLFIYIPVKEAPTRNKYALYYAICSMENIACVVLFIHYAPKNLYQSTVLFYTLCTLAIGFYYVGIFCMTIYYIYFHPNVKARRKVNVNTVVSGPPLTGMLNG